MWEIMVLRMDSLTMRDLKIRRKVRVSRVILQKRYHLLLHLPHHFILSLLQYPLMNGGGTQKYKNSMIRTMRLTFPWENKKEGFTKSAS